MAAIKVALTSWTHTSWMFWLLWMIASFLGAMLYFLPIVGVLFLLGLTDSGGPDFPPDFPIVMRVLAAVLCGAASGSTIALGQWLVLRTRVSRTGWWVAATIAGYAFIGLLPAVASPLRSGWMDWALTLIVNGKMHWLARVLNAWPRAAWAPGAVTLTLFGLVLGYFQWLVLRERFRQAGWWIALSTVGWALAAALWILPSEPGSTLTFDLILTVTIAPLIPYAVAGGGIVWLLKRSAPMVGTLR